VQGSLYALRILARKYEYRDEEDRIPLNQIITTAFPVSAGRWGAGLPAKLLIFRVEVMGTGPHGV